VVSRPVRPGTSGISPMGPTTAPFRGRLDGTFTLTSPEEAGEIVAPMANWGCTAWGDYDNDGSLDLFVTSHGGSPDLLYRNTGNDNHWISLKLVGTVSNRSANGTKVRVLATLGGKPVWQMREIGEANRHQRVPPQPGRQHVPHAFPATLPPNPRPVGFGGIRGLGQQRHRGHHRPGRTGLPVEPVAATNHRSGAVARLPQPSR
jgi:hypothetical protein